MSPTIAPHIEQKQETKRRGAGPQIRCPKCNWSPRAGARWLWSQCGHPWRTFDTGGSVRAACTSGQRRCVCRVSNGRRIQTGTRERQGLSNSELGACHFDDDQRESRVRIKDVVDFLTGNSLGGGREQAKAENG